MENLDDQMELDLDPKPEPELPTEAKPLPELEHIDCRYCEDVGSCMYCERGRIVSEEERQKMRSRR